MFSDSFKMNREYMYVRPALFQMRSPSKGTDYGESDRHPRAFSAIFLAGLVVQTILA